MLNTWIQNNKKKRFHRIKGLPLFQKKQGLSLVDRFLEKKKLKFLCSSVLGLVFFVFGSFLYFYCSGVCCFSSLVVPQSHLTTTQVQKKTRCAGRFLVVWIDSCTGGQIIRMKEQNQDNPQKIYNQSNAELWFPRKLGGYDFKFLTLHDRNVEVRF